MLLLLLEVEVVLFVFVWDPIESEEDRIGLLREELVGGLIVLLELLLVPLIAPLLLLLLPTVILEELGLRPCIFIGGTGWRSAGAGAVRRGAGQPHRKQHCAAAARAHVDRTLPAAVHAGVSVHFSRGGVS